MVTILGKHDKIEHQFMLKNAHKDNLKIIKAIYEKFLAYICNGKRLNVFFQRLEWDKDHSHFLFNTVLGVLVRAIWPVKENKVSKLEKKKWNCYHL